MKALAKHCVTFKQFPPGHSFCSTGERKNEFVRWYNPDFVVEKTPIGGPLPKAKYDPVKLREGEVVFIFLIFFDNKDY